MEFKEFLSIVSQKKKTLWGFVALFLVLGALFVAIQKFQYSSKSQVLVVQENNRTLDAYAASRSNEYLSGILASVISSNSFYTKVTETNFGIETAYFGDNPRSQMETWTKTVKARSVNDSGIISIVVYHPDRVQAEKILRAVNYVLMTQHASYHGAGDTVKVRLIDQPVTSTLPVKPNIPLVGGGAIVIGVLVGLVYIYLNAPHDPTAIPSYGFRELPPGIPSRAFRDLEAPYAAPVPRPEPPRQPPYQSGPVRGQLPEQALSNLDPAHPIPYHDRPEPVTHYGQYAKVPLQPELYDEGGGYFEGDIEPGTLKGNMKNLLS